MLADRNLAPVRSRHGVCDFGDRRFFEDSMLANWGLVFPVQDRGSSFFAECLRLHGGELDSPRYRETCPIVVVHFPVWRCVVDCRFRTVPPDTRDVPPR